MLALSLVLCFCPTKGEHSAVICAWGFAGCVDLEIRLQILPTSFESHYSVIGYCAIQSCDRKIHTITNYWYSVSLLKIVATRAPTAIMEGVFISPACLSWWVVSSIVASACTPSVWVLSRRAGDFFREAPQTWTETKMLWFQANVISKRRPLLLQLTPIKICRLRTFYNLYLDYIKERGAPERLKIGLYTEVQVHGHARTMTCVNKFVPAFLIKRGLHRAPPLKKHILLKPKPLLLKLGLYIWPCCRFYWSMPQKILEVCAMS